MDFVCGPPPQTAYSVKASPWRNGKGDLVREVADAAHKQGLKFGIYLSPWDRHEPRYKNNAQYDEYYRKELTELITRYGEITEFWLDGAGSEGHVYDFDSYVRIAADLSAEHSDLRGCGLSAIRRYTLGGQ